METPNKIPFPQANDFEKIIKLLQISDEEVLLNDDALGEYLDGISSRQARYYIAAAKYIGLVDSEKRFSKLGRKIKNLNEYLQKIELIRLLLSDPVFGKVYITEKVMHLSLDTADIAEIIEQEHPGYCEAIYLRRTQTVKKWLGWVKKHLEN